MTVTHAPPGQLDVGLVGERWILIFGGVTRQGRRNAGRAASGALESGLDVVWFDGFDEATEGVLEREPLDGTQPAGNLVVVDFAEAQSRTTSSRLRSGGSLRSNPVARWIWKVLLRRIGSALRPRSCWLVVKRDLRALQGHSPPEAIVHGDDYAITSAWYSGRIWRSVQIRTGWSNGEA